MLEYQSNHGAAGASRLIEWRGPRRSLTCCVFRVIEPAAGHLTDAVADDAAEEHSDVTGAGQRDERANDDAADGAAHHLARPAHQHLPHDRHFAPGFPPRSALGGVADVLDEAPHLPREGGHRDGGTDLSEDDRVDDTERSLFPNS